MIGAFLKRVGIILFALICAACYVGVWIYAAFQAVWLFIALAGVHLLVAVLAAWGMHRASVAAQAAATGLVYVSLLALLGVALAYTRRSPALAVFVGILFAASIGLGAWIQRAERRGRRLPGIRWNYRKGLSGTLFGDAANFIAIVGGLSGYTLFAGMGDGWWYISLGAAWLALLTGLSLHMRWLNAAQSPHGWEDSFAKTDESRATEIGTTVATEIVGVTALLAILAPTADNHGQVAVGASVSAALLGVVGLLYILYARQRPGRLAEPEAHKRRATYGLLFLALLLTGALAAAILFAIVAAAGGAQVAGGFEKAGQWLGLVGAVAWMGAEISSSWPFTKQWMRLPTRSLPLTGYLGWEKNVWEAAGALISAVYLAVVAGTSQSVELTVTNGQLSLSVWHLALSALFVGGALLAGLGTIRGMVNGVLAQLERA